MAPGGFVFHAFNRSTQALPLFETPEDYLSFFGVLTEATGKTPMRFLAYCLMPNHWHLVLWPHRDGDLSQFLGWASGTHAARWRTCRRSVGRGAVYQSRFKAIPVQTEAYLLRVCRYVERNPVRAHLVERPDDWPWSSAARSPVGPPLAAGVDWPVARPANWSAYVAGEDSGPDLEGIRRSIASGTPIGDPQWQAALTRDAGHWERRPPGRPRRVPPEGRSAPAGDASPRQLEDSAWQLELSDTE
jgi:putative transposase